MEEFGDDYVSEEEENSAAVPAVRAQRALQLTRSRSSGTSTREKALCTAARLRLRTRARTHTYTLTCVDTLRWLINSAPRGGPVCVHACM
jgi:hypothetical protein